MKNAWFKPDDRTSPALEKLLELQKNINPEKYNDFADVLTQESSRRIHHFMAGVKAFQSHPYRRQVQSMPVIWKAGTTEIRDYNPQHPEAPVILVIPSLINRFEILDLDEEASFLRWLAAYGFRPLVVDWNAPGDQEKFFSVESYVTQRLIPFLDFIVTKTHAPLHILGYCMGGLLAVALAALQPRFVRTLTCLATPWDFHQSQAGVGQEFIDVAHYLEPQLKANNVLSVDVIQSLFAAAQPLKVIKKFCAFAAMNQESTEAQRFVVLEDWLNDGIPLAAPVARECLIDWYGNNKPGRGEWTLAHQRMKPETIIVPSYIVVPGSDRIVPPASALSLARSLPHATLHEPMMGHIALMASQRAPHQVWAPLGAWLREHS